MQCGTDADQRALPEATLIDEGMTINMCLSFCASQNYNIGGVEHGSECWCGSSLQNGQGVKVADEECSSPCRGDQSRGQCGGEWRISLFSSLDESSRSSAFAIAAPSASSTDAGALQRSTEAQADSYTPIIPIPGNGTKYV